MKILSFPLFFSVLIPHLMVFANVQRTVSSSYPEYLSHLQKTQSQSFVESYIQISSVTELETPLLEKCLEEMYLGAPWAGTCFEAVKSLTSRPLNQARREVLFSFLSKLEKQPSPQSQLYRSLKSGLLRTHPNLGKTFGVESAGTEKEPLKSSRDLEMGAWKKAVTRKFPLEEAALLINGTKVSRLKDWRAPEGVFQWALISNTHEPVLRIGTFSQFAAESVKSLKAFADVNCNGLQDLDPPMFGLIQVEIFADPKCFRSFGTTHQIFRSPHLGDSQNFARIENQSSRHWVWPALAVLTVGIANHLKGKQVTVEWPTLK